MNAVLLISFSLTYLLLLFFVAAWAQKRDLLKHRVAGKYIYALSLAVYSSAWTFYGSIGRAATSGLDFLAIYLGPVLVFPLWWIIVRKIIRVVKSQHINSLADFLAARYGKNQGIGSLVSLLLLFAITPYIALQTKAIADSFSVVSTANHLNWLDPALFTTIALSIFTLIYGTLFLYSDKAKSGMISAIAFESIVKLIAFLAGGFFLVFLSFNGMGSLFKEAVNNPELSKLIVFDQKNSSDWFWLLLVSAISIVLLPRQFQLGIIENQNEKHLPSAMWIVPLYLLLINIFVIPIALLGKINLPANTFPDYYFLHLSQQYGNNFITALVYFGGFSAATSMIIVSSLSLGNMLSTHLVLPLFIRPGGNTYYSGKITYIRVLSLILIFVMAYAYYHYLAFNVPLVSIGITSFAGIAQLAPAFFGGLYWQKANRKAAKRAILTGFAIWFYGMILPNILRNIGWGYQFLEEGAFGIRSLSPLYFGEASGLSPFSAVMAFSLIANSMVFFLVSALASSSTMEMKQAQLFTNIFLISSQKIEEVDFWKHAAPFSDVKSLLINVLGDRRTEQVLDRYARINHIDFSKSDTADAKMINYAERLLTESIGPASARIMIASVAKGDEIGVDELMGILHESKQLHRFNKALRQKTEELQKVTSDLTDANRKLQEFSEIKDEFLYTITHELRTPLTVIRSQAEMLLDEKDMPAQDQEMFLDVMVKECERLTTLITNVLDLEKYESGNQQLELSRTKTTELLQKAVLSLRQLTIGKPISIDLNINSSIPDILTDTDRIYQVFVNLLSNAVKFCNQEEGRVVVSAYRLNDEIKIVVEDNGKGIVFEERERVFEKFYQMRNQTLKKPVGSGLGLAISKNIVKMHNGALWAELSDLGGAKFCLTLPVYINGKRS